MPATAYGELSQFESSLRLVETSAAAGILVREKRLGEGANFVLPARLHLLYVALTPDARFAVRHLAIDGISAGNIEANERALLLEARTTVPGGPPSTNERSRGFEGIMFQRPAYFTIVIDEVGWEFYFPAPAVEGEVIQDQTHDPVVFLGEKTVILAATAGGTSITKREQKFDPNHAFSDATQIDLAIAAGESRKALRMINFFTDENGQVLNHVTNFGFEINLRAPAAAEEHLTTIIIDPDGQNQGPPH